MYVRSETIHIQKANGEWREAQKGDDIDGIVTFKSIIDNNTFVNVHESMAELLMRKFPVTVPYAELASLANPELIKQTVLK